jgi:cellulose synthase/poly-beta-1,6-N-acetylglucosamine synthase-like glycosyltransferase
VKLICIDLAAPLPGVPPCTEGEQWVLVRLHGDPLGMVYPPREGCSATELARIVSDAHGWAIAQHLLADRFGEQRPVDVLASIPASCPRHAIAPNTRVTAAVCTRHRASQLASCLDALTALDYPRPLLDVIVVDNAPVDASTRDLVARYPGVRYVCEPRPGLDNARNRAIEEARGEILAYTDDDVIVDRGWVRAIARAFEEEPHAMCVTGLVVPDELDTPSQILFERYGGFGRGFRRWVHRVEGASAMRHHGGTGRFGTGANMAFRTRFFAEQGRFDPHLDVGTPASGGGDLEMFFRVLKHGHALVYEPAALVRHRHRRTYPELRTQIANNGIGFYAYLTRTARAYPDERLQALRLGAWWLWWWNLRRLAAGLLGRGRVPLDLVIAELKGSFVGLSRYRPQGVS